MRGVPGGQPHEPQPPTKDPVGPVGHRHPRPWRPRPERRCQPGDGKAASQAPDRNQAAQDHKQVAQDRKEAAKQQKEDRKELRDAIKECKAAGDNATANATAKRCDHLKDAAKARRVAHALLTAIRVHERELGRVTFRIAEIQKQLQNSTLNATVKAHLQERLGHLQDRQAKLIEKIADEQAKLQRLHDKWSEVADHLRDRREKGEEDGGVEDGSASASASPSTSASATASGSATAGA